MTRFHNALRCSIAVLLLLLGLQSGAEESLSYSFLAVGDTGCGCRAQENIAARMWERHKTSPFDAVLMLGDNIYGESYLKKLFFARKSGGHPDLFAGRFNKYYQPLLDAGIRFFAAIGNHDTETRDGYYEIADKERFHIQGDLGYYAFSPHPLVTFFALNSTRFADGKTDSSQVAWLKTALAEARTPWKIIFVHHPMYAPSGGHRPNSSLREAVEPVLVEGGVRIVLAGHVHTYARMKAQHGITHFISGGGGRHLITPHKNEDTIRTVKAHHFLQMQVFEHRIVFHAVSERGFLIDQGTILR